MVWCCDIFTTVLPYLFKERFSVLRCLTFPPLFWFIVTFDSAELRWTEKNNNLVFASESPALCCSVLLLKRVVAVGKASAGLSSHQFCPIKSPAGAVEGPPQGTSATTPFP